LDEARIVFGGASARQDAVDRVAGFKEHTPIQLEWIVKKANTETSRLSVAVEDSANARQDDTILVVHWENAGQRLLGRKLQADKPKLPTARVNIIETHARGK
jgi:hypothetical protein